MRSEFPVFVLWFSCLQIVYTFPSASDNFGVCQRANGNFPKPGSVCRSYYRCKNWRAVEEDCPRDQHFFPARGYCVWPEEYPCNESSKDKKCPLPDGKFLKPGSKCKKYYDCRKGKPDTKKCKGDLLFDQKRSKCDWPELVTCPDEPKSKECPLPNGDFLKSGTGCKKFYSCRNGVAKEKRCPGDQRFDPAKQRCEWPELYTCIEDPESKECPRPNGKFLRPGTLCKIYYDCREGVSSEKRCPKDQLFDPAKQKCEWPEIYTCVEDLTTTDFPVSSTKKPTTDSDENSSEEGNSSEDTTITTMRPTTDSDENSSEEGNSSEEDTTITTMRPTTDSDENSSEEGNSSEENVITTTVPPISSTETPTASDENIITITVPPISSTETPTASDENIITVTDPPISSTETPTASDKTEPTTVTAGITDSVTVDIFCPKPSGYFPHPNDRHKFIACVGGIPTVMDCPANLVYDHKKRSCEYDV